MSIIVPLHKWRSADPAILIGRRPEWWIRIFHRKPYETIIQQIRRETK